jgi:hypothetical protein
VPNALDSAVGKELTVDVMGDAIDQSGNVVITDCDGHFIPRVSDPH